MKITNLLLWVQDNTLSVKFYKKLGFTITRSDDTMSVVSIAGFDIWLLSMRDEDQFTTDALATHKGKGMYIYIAVDNVDELYRKLVRKGVYPATEPRDWPWGNREFIVKDLDGYKLCFWHRIAALPN